MKQMEYIDKPNIIENEMINEVAKSIDKNN
jgi:hypothetical protein